MLCGVVTEHAQMYNHLTGMQNLVFYGTLFGMSAEKSRSRATALLEQLSLLESAGQKLGTYSTGMRQRLSLARAMMHSPKLLFLDEPTAGLDPQSTHEVNHLIQGLAETQGTTVFLCTHQLRYAQEICTSYGLIDGGRMLAVGQLEQLRALVCPGVTVMLRASSYPPDLLGQATEEGMEVSLSSEEEIPLLVRKIVEQGGSVYHVSARQPSLEKSTLP